MELLDQYFGLQKQIYDYFGYREDWVVIPLDDAREYYWRIEGGEGSGGRVVFAKSPDVLPPYDSEKFLEDLFRGVNVHDDEQMKALLADDKSAYYSNLIYTQRFLPKWVYRGEKFTMICVDTRTDGNKFLQIFDNEKERPLQ
jgi:hypothetical protein